MPNIKDKSLTDKQQAFVQAYTTNGYNATQAARQAGYKGNDNTMRQTGFKLVTNGNVKRAIAAKKQEKQEKADYNYDKAIAALDQRIAYLEPAASKGNIQAVVAQTALIREKDNITGLNKTNVSTTTDQPKPLTEAERAELAALAKLSLGLGQA